MTDLVVLGTDTNAGKTTFCLLWLKAKAFDYWKPVETGESDSLTVARLVPGAVVHPSVKRFKQPLAPPLAARLEKDTIPPAGVIAAARPLPTTGRPLLIETFGSPFSPLNEGELQIHLIKILRGKSVLVSSSALGAVGRTLSCLEALAVHGVLPAAIVLIGKDPYAEAAIRQYSTIPVFSLLPPITWDCQGIMDAARDQKNLLDDLENCLEDNYRLPGSKPIPELHERDKRAVWHPYTSLRETDAPLECVGALDEFLFLADGRKVIDGISSWWTILHGHRHPVLLKALREASEIFDHVHFAGVTHAPAVELAELLLSTAPWPGGKVFYSDNGSTAVEVALKMAYQFWCHQGEPRRTLFIGFAGGYHGDTFGAMAVGRDPVFFGRFEPLLFRAEIVPLSPEILDDILARHKSRVAAVILEPLVQGAGGMRMHGPERLRQLFEVTKNHGVLFIADEVMTGGGRTGSLWAHQQAGIAPDLICAAKTLAGGLLPLAATLAAPHIVAAWDTDDPARTFFHGHSFTAHPLACAVAAANWKMLTAAPLQAPPRMEVFWKTALEPLRTLKQVRDMRLCGTIAAVEVDVAGGYLAETGRTMRRQCLAQGVVLRPLGSVLYAMPPFCISPESLGRIAAAMIQAVEKLAG